MERSQGNVAYALKKQEGWIYNLGVDFIVKLGERGQGRRLAVLEYLTADDEWPGHSHPTEDEFDVEQGGFVFLPRGIEHGYRIRGDSPAHLLVVTAPAPGPEAGIGWDGFVSELETTAELRASPPAP